MRRIWADVRLALLHGACDAGEISLSECVERINTIVNRASEQYEALVTSPQGAVLVVDATQLSDLAPPDLQVALERVREIGAEFEEAVSTIEPPEQVADLHYLFFDFDDDFISAQEALVL
jgi:hypothetical protein